MDPFCPEFLRGVMCLGRVLWCNSIPIFRSSVALYPGRRNPIVLTPSIRKLILSTIFLRLFTGLPIRLSVSEWTLVAEFAS